MTHRVARLRSLGLFALIAWLVACNPFSATPSPSPTPSAVQSTATASPAPTATATPAPTASPRPNPTTGPGTYTNAGLAYRLDIPSGWRRSACQTTRGDPKVPFVGTFTTAPAADEIGTEIGPR